MKAGCLAVLATVALLPGTLWAALDSAADQRTVEVLSVSADGVGESIGKIHFLSTEYGVLFRPELEGLDTGLHGFHLHQKASCEPAEKNGNMTAAAAAGGHLNPNRGQHNGPYEKGHLGDLPALYFNEEKQATHSVLAPRLHYKDLAGHALIIHTGGDNYSDEPEALGGGGARVACVVISE